MKTVLEWEQKGYMAVRKVRDYLFLPLIKVLDTLGLKPLMLSLMGVIGMSIFALFISSHPVLAVMIGFGSLLLDWLDGPLARYQGTASDKGKFIDVLCDNLAFVIFMIGISHAGIVDIHITFYITLSIVLTKILGIIKNTRYLSSDWFFKPTAGFLPGLVMWIWYVTGAVLMLRGFSGIQLIVEISTLLLLIDVVLSIFGIFKKGYNKPLLNH